jgi:hypothetical protein
MFMHKNTSNVKIFKIFLIDFLIIQCNGNNLVSFILYSFFCAYINFLNFFMYLYSFFSTMFLSFAT